MAEIYLDNPFWKAVNKEIAPKAKYWFGKARTKEFLGHPLIPKSCIIEISEAKIKKGDIINQLIKETHSREFDFVSLQRTKEIWKNYGGTLYQDEIELAIVKVLIQKMQVSGQVLYGGKRVFEDSAKPSLRRSRMGFVYMLRNGDLVKIGITQDLLRRLNELKPEEVVGVILCSNYSKLEKSLHKFFEEKRLPQTEYFRLSEAEVCEAIEMMHKGASL
jgi:hypothetical protein